MYVMKNTVALCIYLIHFLFPTSRYGLVEQIDSQLRRIGQDLRDVIDQMNTTAATTTNDGTTEVCVEYTYNV